MANTLSTLSTVAFALALIFLILAVFFWFYFRIPVVFGDLSGRTAQKSIAAMRAANEKTGKKSFGPGATNEGRGKLTGTMKGITPKGPQTAGKHTAKPGSADETMPLVEDTFARADETMPLVEDTMPLVADTAPLYNETAPLYEGTAPLYEGTAPLYPGAGAMGEETGFLDNANETAVLGGEHQTEPLAPHQHHRMGPRMRMRMITEVVLVHTNESI